MEKMARGGIFDKLEPEQKWTGRNTAGILSQPVIHKMFL
jgi:hypothetical protein